ncbi:hypothetical protein B0T25DRAFT_334358 [Lasiosphaeria hispida]|uniref:Uncharacterized protein n=1 Tax=Lasiosphaeria hispida TaxID=260671 RepID=A0AAJ0H6F1_9PEZI|nr:hypothetical protein B0T25DRAFT_334358 [Lasiosphaeria hispida]
MAERELYGLGRMIFWVLQLAVCLPPSSDKPHYLPCIKFLSWELRENGQSVRAEIPNVDNQGCRPEIGTIPGQMSRLGQKGSQLGTAHAITTNITDKKDMCARANMSCRPKQHSMIQLSTVSFTCALVLS